MTLRQLTARPPVSLETLRIATKHQKNTVVSVVALLEILRVDNSFGL